MTVFTIDEKHASQRLDTVLAKELNISRVQTQKLIKEGAVCCDGEVIKKTTYRVKQGQEIVVSTAPTSAQDGASCETKLTASNIPINIIFEDEHLIVVNKPAGMITHPGAGVSEGTLANAVLFHCQEIRRLLDGIPVSSAEAVRPGIVHRLDKDTSGLILIAKTVHAHAALAKQFDPATRRAGRTYVALVYGTPERKSGLIETGITRHRVNRQQMCAVGFAESGATSRAGKGEATWKSGESGATWRSGESVATSRAGKRAVTEYRVENSWSFGKESVSLLKFHLYTGRTHQIRVHCQFLKHPVIGDKVYKGNFCKERFPQEISAFPRQALHAIEISFSHPQTNERMVFETDLPEDMQALIDFCDGFPS
ncbi:MAG: RluA family pseudouridine synthase [Holosporales bacterium]|jgi:23S rRNA pseudouridine1911/1915/1917 synthase|nr:RluA family pseudouridine synthase [Holosporales bacterium]